MAYWAEMVEKFKTHMKTRDIESFFLLSVQSRVEMEVVYTRNHNIQKFLEWLEYRAALEAAGDAPGTLQVVIGGI